MKQKNFILSLMSIGLSIYSFAQTARVQIIHNSADLSAETVDVYLDNTRLIDNFEFRTATAFQDVTADTPINIRIAPSNSATRDDFFYELETTLNADETYILVANGIRSTSGYVVNDNFTINVFNMAREASNVSGNTDILVHHGSIDAESIDVNLEGSNTPLVNNLAYSEFSNGYISLFSNTYAFNLTADSDGNLIAEYTVPFFPTYNNEAITLVASGFRDPSANSNGEPFGLWLATADGGPLTELEPSTLNVDNVDAIEADIFPNPVTDYLNINLAGNTKTELTLYDIQGRQVLSQDLDLENEIFLGDLSNGIYVMNLSNEFGNKTMKIRVK
ncbi:MAG: DUF4397 domain-containing protein [Bacteroidota bacterium]